ncbi:MAG: hypothetical protein MJZ22_00430 [Candidatus Saccharibacteria bacterium]|nr:hypothetical protein [Candidatus Saccharibacteria bacterium]
MAEFIIRTEELTNDQISDLYVASENEQSIINKLKAPSPVLLIGSRGVGKSFLFKKCEIELLNDFSKNRVLPIYLTFRKASLINTSNSEQFQYWMLARICAEVVRALKKKGLLSPSSTTIPFQTNDVSTTALDKTISEFEESWKNPGKNVNTDDIPTLDDFLSYIEDICIDLDIKRIILFVDEAAHVFLPMQQRSFFTLFRDLRSPYIKCNAAVYPGVTVYGDTFEPTHDAVKINLVRKITDENYIANMKKMVMNQVEDGDLSRKLLQNGENFTLLAYAASGNPRYLLNSINMAEKLDSNATNSVFREYYREKQWAEHSCLAERYPGYKKLIEWGRDFLETQVIPELKNKNDAFLNSNIGKGTTLYFWIQNGAPQEVREALRILEYSGLVYEDAPGIRASRSEVGTRYMVNIGCLLAIESKATSTGLNIIKDSDIRRMSEYGSNQPLFAQIQGCVAEAENDVIKEQFTKSIDVLDLTNWQKQKMHEININTIGELIAAPESKLKEAKQIADVRARMIKNAVVAALCEYLLG